MNVVRNLNVIFGQIDQGWRERDYPSDEGGGSVITGFLLLGALGLAVAWLRTKSEDAALGLLMIGVIAGSIWAAIAEGGWIWFFFGLIALGTLASIIWIVSGIFYDE